MSQKSTKESLWLLLMLFFCLNASGFDPGKNGEPKKRRSKIIYFHKINDDAAWLKFDNGGKISIRPALIIGARKIEPEGFRFVPASNAPEGMMSQHFFDRKYRYNSLVKEIFIPYSEIKHVRLGYFSASVKILTNEGKRYQFKCLWPKKVAEEIRSHLSINSK